MVMCVRCGKDKPESEFGRRAAPGHTWILRGYCRLCGKEAKNPGTKPRWRPEPKRAHPSKGHADKMWKALRQKNRVPAWADRREIEAVYARARDMRDSGFPVEVDHIVPLRGETVSGLHNQFNLQILPHLHNVDKGAHTWPDMPE